jgi:hypothetical protein
MNGGLINIIPGFTYSYIDVAYYQYGFLCIVIYLFKFIVLMQPFGYERPTPHLILTDNIHSDTQAEPRKLSSLTLYIDLWQEGKPAPGQNPPVISPPVVIFRRIGVRAEIRTQNPVLSNTRLVKMVPLGHLRRLLCIVCWNSRNHTLPFFSSYSRGGYNNTYLTMD